MVTQARPALTGLGTVNPTLTIIANALRVAGHIAERLGATAGEQARPALTEVTGHA
jgi:hypothetical protein